MPAKLRQLLLVLLFAPFAALASSSLAEGPTEPSMTHRMMLVAMQLGLLLFATKWGNILFEKWRLPGVLGELAAGMAIGPYLLGALPLPGFPHGLFPPGQGFAVSPELYGFCTVASIILLFMVGLETDIQQFLKYSVAGGAVGVGGVVASFVLGDLIAVAFGNYVFGAPVGFMSPECLFLGVISTATSVGITARILTEKRKLDSPEGVTILAGAVVDDVLGIILLTLVLGVIKASQAAGVVDWGHIGIIGAKAVGIWLVATVLGLVFSKHLGTMLKKFRGRSSIAVMALGLALILSGLFEEAGLAMIIGAYVMGLSLSRTDIAHVIREMLMPIYVFLVPVFFGVMGMLVDFRALGDRHVLIFGLVYSLVAVVAKIVGSGGVALLFNFNLRGAIRIGSGMVPRGEVALIVAGIGLAAGALTPEVFGVAILMTVLTTVAAPPLLVKLFAAGGTGLRRPTPAAQQESIRFAFPSPELTQWVFAKLQEVFQQEGFFVHSLEHEHEIVQARREFAVINLWPDGTDLVFSCHQSELPMVRTAVYEVLATIKGTIRTLQEPVDVATVVDDMQRAPAGATASTFARSLSLHVLSPALKGNTKEEILAELLDLLVEAGLVVDRAAAYDGLLQRERSMSTGLQRGVAIPHARTKGVEQLVCAVGLKPQGVDFQALDRQPSHIFVMTLSPEGAATPHVQFMSEISQALSPAICDELLRCTTKSQMLSLLLGHHRQANQPAAPSQTASAATPSGPAGSPARTAFSLADYLLPELIIVDLQGTTKFEVITELLEQIGRHSPIADPIQVRQALLQREKLISTGLEKGVAVPHCRTDAVDRLTCAIGIKRAGVYFDSLDGQPARLVALTLVPLSKPVPYVQFVTSLVMAIDKLGTDQLAQATSPAQVRSWLCQAR